MVLPPSHSLSREWYSGTSGIPFSDFPYGAFTLYGVPFQGTSGRPRKGCPEPAPHIPQDFRPGVRFVLCRFRSPLLTASLLLSFPPLTEMLHFSGFPFAPKGANALAGARSHSAIPGSKAACASPGLIAACHDLRRFWKPSHPPDSLGHRPTLTSAGLIASKCSCAQQVFENLSSQALLPLRKPVKICILILLQACSI